MVFYESCGAFLQVYQIILNSKHKKAQSLIWLGFDVSGLAGLLFWFCSFDLLIYPGFKVLILIRFISHGFHPTASRHG